MSTKDKININVTKFWILIILVAILGLGMGFMLGKDSNQTPIIIEQGSK